MTSEWLRILWKPQPYPDNYIPQSSFLSSLRKNPNFRPYTYTQLVLLSYPIAQHLATIFIFIDVFVHLHKGTLHPPLIIWTSVVSFLFGYTIWEFLGTSGKEHRAKTIKSSILTFLALMSLSPVLRTLTAATSSDSIWALSATLFFLNAILADYSPLKSSKHVQERLTSVLSMNAAISSSVVLASRLSSDVGAFSLVLFSIHVFALFPLLRRRLQCSSHAVQAFVTLTLTIPAIGLVAQLSSLIAILYSVILLFVTLVAPLVLVWAQRYKNEIQGPWDAAVPKIN